jgi:hypothetical protein
MSVSKILGIFLLFTGLAINFWGIYQVYGVYTQKIEPPIFFEPVSSLEKGFVNFSSKNLEQQLQSAIQEQLKKILPSEYIASILNFVAFSILIGLIIFGGTQISYIGVKLIKN